MLGLFIYSVMMYGFSFCLVYSVGPFRIFELFRDGAKKYLPSNLGDAYECMFCTPFQLGIIFSIINMIIGEWCFTPSYYINNCYDYWYLDLFIDGAFTAGIVYLINTLQEFLEKNED